MMWHVEWKSEGYTYTISLFICAFQQSKGVVRATVDVNIDVLIHSTVDTIANVVTGIVYDPMVELVNVSSDFIVCNSAFLYRITSVTFYYCNSNDHCHTHVLSLFKVTIQHQTCSYFRVYIWLSYVLKLHSL